MNELCPHGRISGAYCEACAEKEYPPPCYGPLPESVLNNTTNGVKVSTGLDASYYDFPPMKSAMELIEYLDLNFSQGNILKSLVRENNPNVKKETTALYEAEKRYYYSDRDLCNVRKKWASGGGNVTNAEKEQAQVPKE